MPATLLPIFGSLVSLAIAAVAAFVALDRLFDFFVAALLNATEAQLSLVLVNLTFVTVTNAAGLTSDD